jgi:uncharacterized protein YndB with AHSA1/START domain
MNRGQPPYALEITRVLAAPPELVFEAWTSAEHARHWWFPGPSGREFTCVAFALHFRVGGDRPGWCFDRNPSPKRHAATATRSAGTR